MQMLRRYFALELVSGLLNYASRQMRFYRLKKKINTQLLSDNATASTGNSPAADEEPKKKSTAQAKRTGTKKRKLNEEEDVETTPIKAEDQDGVGPAR